ncbi:APC family permease [Neisseriaceae bacterium JH1-16]|nr:APC family permease [Neisseriaceae bacterium JH1-16]
MNHHTHRTIGAWPLMMTGLGSIIGSGWLFGAWKAAMIAGPAAIFAWLIGMLVILAIALSYVELGVMFPESGGMVRYARYSHGSLVGFIAAWANWIAIVSVIPVEAEASIQYMSSWPWAWAQALFYHDELTTPGLLLAAVLVVIYFLLNYWGVKLFAKANSLITLFKLAIPALTAFALIHSGFHADNFHAAAHGGFAPFGWSAVLTAVATSGIVFSFNGFQSPINLAGEARNPARSIPFAVVFSILLAAVIYVLLQVAFVGSLSPEALAQGWSHLNFSSPFAQLALALNLNWLCLVLYLDAFVSPSGTGSTYMATTARMIYAMEKNGTMPSWFGQLHPLYNVPRPAMWFNLLISFGFLFFFRGWGTLAAVISVATVISFLTGPVSTMALRRAAPELPRPLRIPGIGAISAFAFVCASLVLYWARWPLTGQIFILIAAALPIYAYYQARAGWPNFARDWRATRWLVVYLLAMAAVSYFGSREFGGSGAIPFGWDMGLVSLLALGFFRWGVASGWRTDFLAEAHPIEEEEAGPGTEPAPRLAGQRA